MYQLQKDMVLRLSDGANIPFDEDNSDYAVFLEWLREGNTPIPHDGQRPPIPQEG